MLRPILHLLNFLIVCQKKNFLIDVTPFFEELKQILQQHGIHIFQALTDVSKLEKQIHDLVEEISKHQNSLPAKENQ